MKDYQHFLLSHAAGHINHTLETLGLTPKITPEAFIKKYEGRKHRYATQATNADGCSVIFYARLHNNEDARHKFIQDVYMLDKLSHSRYALARYVPAVYAHSIRKNHEWFVRENLKQPAVGNVYKEKTNFTQHDVLRFVHLFHALQTLPKFPQHQFERRDANFFLQISEGNLRQVKSLFPPSERAQIISHLHAEYQTIQSFTTHLVHGDCHPGNILMDKRHLYLIDWETTQRNLRTTDIGYFYLSLSGQPKFRRELLQSFSRHISWKKRFHQLFPLSALFFALNHLYTLSLHPVEKLSIKEKRSITHFAQAVVKTAIKGYTALERL
ncbi:MAG: aminoglycoside phosphotransferase family protein [Patescibacteria group bacterium]|jgi:thiamine kinase-like enzyme